MFKDGKVLEETGDYYCLKNLCAVNVGGKIKMKTNVVTDYQTWVLALEC